MNLKYLNQFVAITTALLMVSSCKVTEQYVRPAVRTDSLFRGVTTADTTTMANIPWTQMFKDANLQSMLRDAINNNNDLKVAVARIKQAEANFEANKSGFFSNAECRTTGYTTESSGYTRRKFRAIAKPGL